MSALVWVVVWCWTGVKPLPEPMLTQFLDAWMQHKGGDELTHWDQVTHICVIELGHHWFRQWLVVCLAPSHYLDQCWKIFNWTFRNKLQWNFNRNSNIFIQEVAFENVVCKIASICLSLNELMLLTLLAITVLCVTLCYICWHYKE